METSADESSPTSPDRLCARAFGNSLVSAALMVPASLIFRSSLPLMLQLTAGLLLWAAASAFLLVAMLFSLTSYKASKRLPLRTAAAMVLPVLAAVLVALF